MPISTSLLSSFRLPWNCGLYGTHFIYYGIMDLFTIAYIVQVGG